jgi:uncharacterized damage-inducible protein DinB
LTVFLLIAASLTLLPYSAPAQDRPTGARGEFLSEVSYYETRFTRLADAVPADKYSWRPADGVRSLGEVYAHIAAANYNLARVFGTPLPNGVDVKTIVASASDKTRTLQTLKDSFAHLRGAILAIKDSDLNNPQKLFGQDTTVRGAFFLITGHLGEHLGQSIAYARQNGVVPPWTADRLQQESQKPK